MEGVRFGEPSVVARAGAGGQVVGICMGPEPTQVWPVCAAVHRACACFCECKVGFARRSNEATNADALGGLQVTCTLVPHGVQVVDVTSSTCVLSWGLKGRTPLLPAAVVGAGERLVLACEDGAVLSWRTKETTDLSKADVLKGKARSAKLQMLLVEPSLEAILLIYTDGHVRLSCVHLSPTPVATALPVTGWHLKVET